MYRIIKSVIISLIILTFTFAAFLFLRSVTTTEAKDNSTRPFKAKVEHLPIDNVQIAYYTRGKGEPILLFEGFGMSMEDWGPSFIQTLSAHNQVIVFDYRGVGLSEGDVQSLTMRQLTADSIAILDHLHIRKSNIVGWSMGSLVAQEIARDYPERVDHLVLLSTFTNDIHNVDPSPELSDKVQANLDDSWEEFAPMMFNQDGNGQAAADSYLRRVRESIKTGESPDSPDVTVEMKIVFEQTLGEMVKEGDRSVQLSTIKVPTLIMAGQSDEFIPYINNEHVADAISSSQLIGFPDGDHAFLFAKPLEVADKIYQFIR